jgi:hypothetical protein
MMDSRPRLKKSAFDRLAAKGGFYDQLSKKNQDF